MSGDKSYLARVQSMPRYYAGGLVRELSEKNVFLFAQAIAFKVLVTIVPIVILLMGILGDILGQDAPFATVSRFVRGFLPPYQSERLMEFLSAFQGASGTFLSVGTIGLLLTAMTLATTLRVAVSNAFEQDWNRKRSLVGGYAFDLRMVVQVGLLFMITVGFSVVMQALSAEGVELLSRWGLETQVQVGRRGLTRVLSVVVPLMVSAAMFFQLFYFVPMPHPPRTSAALGASVTAVLWEAAKYGFTFYATSFGPFYQSSGDGLAAVTSSFGLLIAFVVWVYYSGIVLMMGAVIASLHEQRRRVRQQYGQAIEPGRKLDAAARQRPDYGEDGAKKDVHTEKARDEGATVPSTEGAEATLER